LKLYPLYKNKYHSSWLSPFYVEIRLQGVAAGSMWKYRAIAVSSIRGCTTIDDRY